MDTKTKNIYVVISRSHTIIGKVIRRFTKETYSHASISFDESLNHLYSFSRYKKIRPFYSGFTEESLLRYTDGKKTVKFLVFEIPVTEEKYFELKKHFKNMLINNKNYRYSIIEALSFLSPFGKIVIDDKYTCISFVIAVLKYLEAINPEFDTQSFKKLAEELDKYYKFERLISQASLNQASWGNDKFLSPINFEEDIVNFLKKIDPL